MRQSAADEATSVTACRVSRTAHRERERAARAVVAALPVSAELHEHELADDRTSGGGLLRGAPYDVRGWLFVIARDVVLCDCGGVRGRLERQGPVYMALEAERPLIRRLRSTERSSSSGTRRWTRGEDYRRSTHLRRDQSTTSLSSSSYPVTTSPGDLSRLRTGSTASVRLTLPATRSRHNCGGLGVDLRRTARIERVAGRHVRDRARSRPARLCPGNETRELRSHAAAARPTGHTVGLFRQPMPAAQVTLSRLGRLAQLGERLPYKQITGSSPVPPISTRLTMPQSHG